MQLTQRATIPFVSIFKQNWKSKELRQKINMFYVFNVLLPRMI